MYQTIEFAGFLHMRQMSGLLENVNREARCQRFGVGDRDDPIFASPDDLHRQF
jgi:hypothetical protein